MLENKNRAALLPRLSKLSSVPLLNLVPLNADKSRGSIENDKLQGKQKVKLFEEYRPRGSDSDDSSRHSSKARKKTLKKAHLASLKTKLERSFQISEEVTKALDCTYASASLQHTEFEIDKLLLKPKPSYLRYADYRLNFSLQKRPINKTENKAAKSLIHAVLSGMPQMVKVMIKDCPGPLEKLRTVRIRDQFERTALHYASFLGNVSVCEKILASGGDPCDKDCLGRTPLHYAVIGSREQIIDTLVRFKANQGKTEPYLGHHRSSSTPLLKQAESLPLERLALTRPELTEFSAVLQEMDSLTTDPSTPGFKPMRSADDSKYIDIQDKFYRTPLHYAAAKESYRMIKMLCALGASLDLEDCQRKRPADCSEQQALKKFMIFRMRMNNSQSDMRKAVRRRKEPAVRFLLERGAVVTKINKSHWNALHLAVKTAFWPILRMLLDDSPHSSQWKLESWKAMDQVTSEGYSVLHLAAKQNDSELMQFLVKHFMLRKAWVESQQPKPDSEQVSFAQFEALRELRCKGGYTALLLAVRAGNLGTVKYLVKQGANLYAKTESLQNAMHLAVQEDDKDMLEFLVYQDSDENIMRAEVDIRMRKPKDLDITGKLAASFQHIWDCAATGNISRIKALVSTGSLSVNEQTKQKQNSVLHVAVEKAQVICVRELMDMSADPNIKNAAGKTPADVAAVIKDPRYESVIYRLIKGEGAEGFEDVELQALSQAYRPFVQIQLAPDDRKEAKAYSEEWTPEKRALVALLRDKLVERGMSVADAFELVDKDKDFCLEKVEFEGLLLTLGIHASTAQVAELLYSLDHYRTGRIEYAAVVSHIKEANKLVQERGTQEEQAKLQGINLSSKLFRGGLRPLDAIVRT